MQSFSSLIQTWFHNSICILLNCGPLVLVTSSGILGTFIYELYKTNVPSKTHTKKCQILVCILFLVEIPPNRHFCLFVCVRKGGKHEEELKLHNKNIKKFASRYLKPLKL